MLTIHTARNCSCEFRVPGALFARWKGGEMTSNVTIFHNISKLDRARSEQQAGALEVGIQLVGVPPLGCRAAE